MEIGRLDNFCPNCGTFLERRPSRKTKCPHCGEAIFVRTRPSDRRRVLVTQSDADRIEAEWQSRQPRAQIRPLLDRAAMEAMRPSLAKRFGRDPSEGDLAWAFLNAETLRRAANREWGVYTSVRLSMAAMLEMEGKTSRALSFYFEHCYLCLNGPRNIGRIITNGRTSFARGEPMFRPSEGLIGPVVIQKVRELVERLGLDEEAERKIFMIEADRVYRGMKAPLSPEEAWEMLASQLSGAARTTAAGPYQEDVPVVAQVGAPCGLMIKVGEMAAWLLRRV